MINNNLVGGWALALWKMMEWVTVGMMNFPFFIWKNPKKNSLNHYNPWNSQYMESQKNSMVPVTTNQWIGGKKKW